MNLSTLLRTAFSAALLVVMPICWAQFDPVNDDTDIFLANPSYNAARPNILIFIDNSANWGQSADGADKFTHEKSALISVISGLTDAYNVGLALGTETGGGNSGESGGYIRFAVRQMTATNKTRLVNLISALSESGDRASGARWSAAMREMYQYYAGVPSFAGYNKVKRDYAGNSTNNAYAAGLPGNAFTSAASSTYVSPISDSCQKNFVIFISNGEPGENSASLAQAQAYLSSVGGSTSTIALSPSGQQGNWSDEYANFMANSDCNANFDGVQTVHTYAVDVVPGTTGQGPSTTALLQSMAAKGKGKYFAVSGSNTAVELSNALKTIFNEVQAVNSVFASTTLPVSVNVRGTNLNQVYIGVFRPDANKSPRWLGNLKLYKLGVDTATQTLFLADATGQRAENSSTGFITGSAQSFWTQASTYWGFRDPALNGVGGVSDSPDGDLVEKGGAAQRVRLAYPSDQSGRKLYTCLNNAGVGLCTDQPDLTAAQNAFGSGNARITAADLGAFVSYSISSLTSSGTTATLVLGATPSPLWAASDQIKVAGATPGEYNGTFVLASANNGTRTYTYTLPVAPDASGVLATGASHGLQTGDLVTVSGTAALDASDATVTRIDANTFRYLRSGAAGSNGALTATGKKPVTSLSGSGFSATAVVAGHGYATGATITISGANETAFNKTVSITVADADSFTYSTAPDIISGTANTAKVTAPAHNLSTGQTNVYVTGNSIASYNGGPKSVTKVDNNAVTFSSTQVLTGAGGLIGVRVTNFTHPTTGAAAARNVLTVTTDGNHGIAGPFPFSVTIAGGTNEGAGKDYTIYNGTWSIASAADVISATQYRITNATFNNGGVGSPVTTVVAGKPVTSIGPIVAATGTIRAAKSVSLSGLTALTSAGGAMSAGRLVDGSATERANIIAWVRGADNKENENPATTPAGGDIRPSVHGDVLHSRPAVVNYNRYGDDNDIYAFYGGNDGIFRALKGGISNHASGPDAALAPGSERWGFIPREFFGRLQRQRDQSPSVSGLNPKDYFADGSIGIYQKDLAGTGDVAAPGAGTVTGVIGDNSGDKVYLYVSLRRGGEFMYALDVTNPAAPRLLWRKGAGDAGWELLGQSWSEPRIAKVVANLGNAGNPENVVLIFGAGYDPAVEQPNPCLLNESSTSGVVIKAIGSGSVAYTADGNCTITGATGSTTSVSRTKGGGVLIVDAFNGNVVWQAGSALATSSAAGAKKLRVPNMSCAIPSDATVLDKNRDTFADRVYVGDTCGQVWRLDIAGGDMDEWTVTRIADASSGGTTDIANKRKFLFPPDLVFGTDGVGNYTAVLLGSGDREHAFETVVQNAFYMIKDRDSADPGNPQAGATNVTSVKISGFGTAPTGAVITHLNPGTTGVFDATNIEGANDRGWKIHLSAGEKVVSSAVTLSGTTFFNTNQPSATAGGGSCGSNLGIARKYQVGFADASATIDQNASGTVDIADRSTVHAGGGYLPSPVPVIVEIDGKRYQAVISGTSVQSPPGLTLERRTRVYWYKEVE